MRATTRPTGPSEGLGDMEGEALAFVLGAALLGYPDAEFAPRLRMLLAAPALQRILRESNALETLAPILAFVAAPALLDDLRSEYIECFDRGALSPLYEGEYGRQRMVGKTPVLADLSGFYNAFGFAVASGDEGNGAESGDHIAVELEFMAVLLLEEAALSVSGDAEGMSIVREARRKFLLDHLGGFARGILRRPELARSAAYTAAMNFVSTRVEGQCVGFGIDPPALEGGGSAGEPEDMKCGDCALTALTQVQ